MSSSSGVAPFHSEIPTLRPPERPRARPFVIGTILVVSILLVAGLVIGRKFWPFSEQSVIENLAEASDSTVTVERYHPTYFPVPGCVLEGIEFRHGKNRFQLIRVERMRIEGSYPGILTRHVRRITTDRVHIFIPPFGSHTVFHSQHSKLVVDELVATGSSVSFLSDDKNSPPLRFDVHDALLTGVRWGGAIRYQLKFRNPNPPGEIAVSGEFGPWADGHHEDTPLSGAYKFDHVDLSVYGGIVGILNSEGRFDGVFKHLNVSGITDIPDFEVKDGGHKVRVWSTFDAFVDATRGDTFLNRVEAEFRRTKVIAAGSIAGANQTKGKVAKLRVTSHNGRIEDILGLFTSDGPPMSGPVSLSSNVEIPPGDIPFLSKVRLHGKFGVDEGSFTKPETQRDVDVLSAGARGMNKENPETVLMDLKGQVDLLGGEARFTDLSFGVPGANTHLQGTYDILNYKINLHGLMRVDTKISKTSNGLKSFLLRVMDPFFKKKRKGEVVPVHIEGTYEKPQFGLDLSRPSSTPDTSRRR
jgi:AsmA-like C-terminal region